ncbi:probable disease resistance RPP8-like protein 2 [Coffea arabica]|uniref:Probable disease resistance RPP8-like protein 2 n=1 Tax=Coffea arabica TaxID=13443 RepID=A0ABM4X7Y5_COFAR
MVQKCGYLPLAISVIREILRKKASLDEWTVVNKDIDSYLGKEGSNEDLKIDAVDMYFTWLAEGIILPKKQSGREETAGVVAKQYLLELVSRSMVIVELDEFAAPGLLKYKHCYLHDLMRELCLMKCSEEDYVKVVDFQGGRQPVLECFPVIMDDTTTFNTYRLAIHTDGNFKGDAIGKIIERLSPRLRSITFTDMSQGENFSVDMAWTSSEIFNSCKMDELPLQVLNLPFLQSLNLEGSVWMNPTKIPKLDVVWKAKRLRHLLFPGNSAKMVDQGKFRLCGLVQLEVITDFDTNTMEVADLLELSNIQQFSATIYGNESLSLILNCIKVNWPNIGHVLLAIYNCNFTENESGTNSNLVRKVFNCRHLMELMIEGNLGNKLPRYETNLASSLRRLALFGSEIVEDPMKILEKLPNLRELQLLMNSFMGKEMVCHNMGFPSLTNLSLKGLHNLEKWRIDEGAMCNLMKLEIRNCKKLNMTPIGLRFISTVKELSTADMPAEFIEELQQLMVK